MNINVRLLMVIIASAACVSLNAIPGGRRGGVSSEEATPVAVAQSSSAQSEASGEVNTVSSLTVTNKSKFTLRVTYSIAETTGKYEEKTVSISAGKTLTIKEVKSGFLGMYGTEEKIVYDAANANAANQPIITFKHKTHGTPVLNTDYTLAATA